MKRIVHVSDRDNGGAAVACRRLVAGLRERGETVMWIVGQGAGGGSAISAAAWPPLLDTIMFRLVSRWSRNERVLRYAAERNGRRAVCRATRRAAGDVYHLHGLHEGISFDLLARLGADAPMVWTLHDMWPLTGYCYYSYDCEKYSSGCQGECPQLGRCGAAIRGPSVEWRRRTRLYEDMKKRLVFVAPSRWMADCARSRFGDRIRVEHIPNGVDLAVFRPLGDKSACCRALGLPVDRPIVLAGAVDFDDPRKGTAGLPGMCAELEKVMGVRPLLVGVGGGKATLECGNVIKVGTVADEQLMNMYYNAADVFVLPTRADNLPNMLVEAVAAGTPVVAANVGGCKDIVRDGETGFLAAPDNPSSIATAVARIMTVPLGQRASWRMRCRTHAEREYDSSRQASRYVRIYDDLIADR